MAQHYSCLFADRPSLEEHQDNFQIVLLAEKFSLIFMSKNSTRIMKPRIFIKGCQVYQKDAFFFYKPIHLSC